MKITKENIELYTDPMMNSQKFLYNDDLINMNSQKFLCEKVFCSHNFFSHIMW